MGNNYIQINTRSILRYSMLLALYIAFSPHLASATGGRYNIIQTFDNTDTYFQKLQIMLEENSTRASIADSGKVNTKNSNSDTPHFFEYQIQANDTLLSISTRTRTSISALITVNRSNVSGDMKTGDYIIIPSMKGIFLTLNPKNDIEFLIHHRIYNNLSKKRPLFITQANKNYSEPFYFMPDIPLSKKEYLLWANTSMRHPVLQGYITSYFGTRVSPLSGNKLHHNGIDIASHSSAEIFAVLSGTVIKKDYNAILGYYIIIEHTDKLKTLYGHLLDANVNIGEHVRIGQHIAYMGNTGASTGTHVHFEIHRNNSPVNPIRELALQ